MMMKKFMLVLGFMVKRLQSLKKNLINMTPGTFEIQYDDMLNDVAEKAIRAANEVLKAHNIQLELTDDGLPHDGFEVMTVSVKDNKKF